jgi:hypothetical protein
MTVTHEAGQLAGAAFTRRAWWSLLGFVPSFALAFLVGEGLISALGYPSGGEDPAPWWTVLTAATPAVAVFVLPAVATVWLGRGAMRLGDDRGRLPIIVAIVVATGFVLLNGISALIIWLS